MLAIAKASQKRSLEDFQSTVRHTPSFMTDMSGDVVQRELIYNRIVHE
jgi:hypothetical protein